LSRTGLAALLALAGCAAPGPVSPGPPALVDAAALEPSLLVVAAYATADNFTGAAVPGYEARKCLLTEPAARALQAVQRRLRPRGLGLKLFDCYRPARAVRYFAGEWLRSPDTSGRAAHYPAFTNKQALFDQGFISADSRHARGSTVDLTLVRLAADAQGRAGSELEMGTSFDYFGPEATWAANPGLPARVRANRERLREAMAPEFAPYAAEWWHFRLAADPYDGPMLETPVR
jgi:D-alanyl-D-alanine dipeptidase